MPVSQSHAAAGCLFPTSFCAAALLATGAWWSGFFSDSPSVRAQDPAPADGSKGAKPASVPFELVASNHMVVQAKINGNGPYRLVFDLGAPITLLSGKAGEESGAIPKDAPKSFLMGMRGEGEIGTLEVGDLTASKIPIVVLDHPTLKALGGFLGKPLDGIIGFTFFARYRTSINYQTKTMTFEPVTFQVRNLLKDLPDRLAASKVAHKRVLTPAGLWGLTLGEPVGDGTGVAIRTIRPQSPAAIAEILPGDILTGIDGRWTASPTDVYAAAQSIEGTGPVAVVVQRNGVEKTISVQPAVGF